MSARNSVPLRTNSPDPREINALEAFFSKGLYTEVVNLAQTLTVRFPLHGFAWKALGAALQGVGRVEEALMPLQKAVALLPRDPAAHSNLANALKDLGQLEAAVASCREALKINPDYANGHYNLGVVLQALGQFDKGVASFRRALAIKPDFANAHNNLGGVLHTLGKFDDAVASYKRALAIKPDYTDARLNESTLLLLRGDFHQGWKLYEWRHRLTGVGIGSFPQPVWLGKDSISGKTILVRHEQGLGDFIQFCRYVPMVEALGARVILQVRDPLIATISTLRGNFEILREGDTVPHFDFQCPIMSLPHAFGTTLSTIPSVHPYLHADPGKVDYWNGVLREKTRLRVGLVWSGGFRPNEPDLSAVSERRNIKLSMFSSFSSLDVEFYSLQKGQPAESELSDLRSSCWSGPDIQDFTVQLSDFSDTAALIANLDLVISVDTSTAHLAAALGKEVWLLNRYDTCWRWLLDRSDSPWYPTVTLFRQPTFGDWHSVISQVHVKLEERQRWR